MTKVFVSYSHQQGDWVMDRLVPCLHAGGADVLIDRDRFVAGKAVVGQMDSLQDRAARHVLVLTPDYLGSQYCCHEMDSAIARDPTFSQGIVIPILRDACTLPPEIARPNPLYVDLRDDRLPAPWKLLLDACGADLGVPAPRWLEALDEVERDLRRGRSVNLVGTAPVNWRELIDHLGGRLQLPMIDLEDPRTFSRPGLVGAMLRAQGAPRPVPEKPNDLAELATVLETRQRSFLALCHFDRVADRAKEYENDLFAALRHSVMTARTLVLLIHSHAPFSTFLPRDNPLSGITIGTVDLPGGRAW